MLGTLGAQYTLTLEAAPSTSARGSPLRASVCFCFLKRASSLRAPAASAAEFILMLCGFCGESMPQTDCGAGICVGIGIGSDIGICVGIGNGSDIGIEMPCGGA